MPPSCTRALTTAGTCGKPPPQRGGPSPFRVGAPGRGRAEPGAAAFRGGPRPRCGGLPWGPAAPVRTGARSRSALAQNGGMASGERARYWQYPELPGVDLLHAHYVRKAFSRHTHETFVFAAITEGVEAFHHHDELVRAGPGQIALVNPDTPHTGHAGVPEGGPTGRSTPTRRSSGRSPPTPSPCAARSVSPRPSSTTRTPRGSSSASTGPPRRATRSPPTACSGSSLSGLAQCFSVSVKTSADCSASRLLLQWLSSGASAGLGGGSRTRACLARLGGRPGV